MLPPDLQRLVRMREYCLEIRDTILRCESSFAVFCDDGDLQKSVAFSILQIGELAGGLTESFRKQTGDRIPWSSIRGMRNILAHDYGNVDLGYLWDTAVTSIPLLEAFCASQLPPQ